MALEAADLAVILPAIVEAVLKAMGRVPAPVIKPVTDAERPKMLAFIQRHWSPRAGWKNVRLKSLELEIDGPKRIPNTDPVVTVTQLHVVPVSVLRALMEEFEQAALDSQVDEEFGDDDELPALPGATNADPPLAARRRRQRAAAAAG